MASPLDVLLLESHPGTGSGRAEELEAAGHRVHRCWSPSPERGHADDGRDPCGGTTGAGCPLDGRVDVALLVRRGVSPRLHLTEAGVGCAVRAGVPVVEDGTEALDPFAPYVAGRVEDDDVAGACQAAADGVWEAVADQVRVGSRALLAAEGINPDRIGLRCRLDGDSLLVKVTGPPMGDRLQQALAVRAADALRDVPRRPSRVDISFEEDAPAR